MAVAVESALGHTCDSVEVIVIDDGSTDGSPEVIQAYGDRIRSVCRQNRGGNPTRNELLAMATGEWVQFLDADDYLQPEKVANQLNSTGQACGTVDAIYSPHITEVWRDGRVVEQSTSVIDSAMSLEEQWIRWQVAQTGAVLWRRESLLAIGGWNEAYPCCQDNEVTLRAIQHGLKFHFCPDAGAVYRIWSQATVCRKDPFRVIEKKTHLIDQMKNWLQQQNRWTPALAAAAGQAFFEMSRTMAAYDLPRAVDYQQERRKIGDYQVCGPAAPLSYRVMHRVAGFELAERVARWRRGS